MISYLIISAHIFETPNGSLTKLILYFYLKITHYAMFYFHYFIIILFLINLLLSIYNASNINYTYKFCKSMVTINQSGNINVRNNKYDVTALILARGGSKGVQLKNLQTINGISLIGRSIEVIKSTNLFTTIWVSTDNERIEMEAYRFGVNVHIRPLNVSTDETSSIESVLEFLKYHKSISNLALIQCTSIFINKYYIQQAFELFQQYDCVFSVVRSYKLRWQRFMNKMIPINFNPELRPRRQDWSGELLETGMFYFSTRMILESGKFQNEHCSVVEIQPQHSLEIDTEIDLKLAQCLIVNNQ